MDSRWLGLALCVALLAVTPGAAAVDAPPAGPGTDAPTQSLAPAHRPVDGPTRTGSTVGPAVLAPDVPTGGPTASAVTVGPGDGHPQVEANNTTLVRHEDPDATDEAGRLELVSGHLSERLAGRLTSGAVDISRAEYALARETLGAEYSDSLGKFVDVAGETGLDGAGDRFERARETQRAFADAVEEYRETRAAYDQARANGNDARARRLARELDDQARTVSDRRDDLLVSFDRLANRTNVDLERAGTVVDRTATNVTDTQSEIRAAEFVATDLTFRVDRTTVAYTDPLRASGTLRTEAGEPLSNRRVRLRVADRTLTTRTDARGQFEVTYRPVRVAAGETTLRVAYLPAPESVYDGSNETVAVTVRAVEPAVAITDATATAGFGDDIAATGRVTVGDDGSSGVAGLPVSVSVDGSRLATVQTDADGQFDLSAALPAAVGPGDRRLAVAVAQSNAAVARATAARSIAIESTATALAVDPSGVAPDTVRVRGRLTAAGTPVADRSVRVRVGGETLTTLTTDAEGRFGERVEVPGDRATTDSPAGANGSTARRVTVAVRYDGAGTNLESSRASKTVQLPDGAVTGDGGGDANDTTGLSLGPTPDGGVPWSLIGWVGAGLVGLTILAAGTRLVVRDGSLAADASVAATVGEADRSAGDEDAAASPGEAAGSTDETTATTALAPARTAREEGRPAEAVEAAYGAVRNALAAEADAPPSATHWEFYTAATAADLDGTDALLSLTELYEASTFGPATTAPDDAAEAIALAERLL